MTDGATPDDATPDEGRKPSWMDLAAPASAPVSMPPPVSSSTSSSSADAPTPRPGRSGRRRNRGIAAAAGGVVVLAGAVIAIVLASSGSRSGTLVGDSGATATTAVVPSTSAIVGDAAAELLAKLPAKSISAGSVQLGPNVAITSMTVSKNSDGSFSGSGTITIAGTLAINVNASITDASNWSLTAASAGAQPFKLGTTGITVDPSTISGTIADVGGTITWNLTGNTVTWPIATGASLTTNFSIGTTCPFTDTTKCPSGDNVYLGLPKGSLAISGLPTVNLAGGLTLDGKWARLEGTANASASLSISGASVSMNTPSLTVWRGTRSDSYDPNMVLPDTSALTNGTNLELCGNFAITIPTLVNQATGGCLRWTPNGIVIGQVGLGSGMTLSGGTAPSGTTADIKGIGWSTLSTADLSKITLPSVNGVSTPGAISFSGVATKLFPSTLSLGGKANLPGVVASALGQTSLPAIDVTGQITSNSIALQGAVPVSISFGTEPFKVSVQSLTLGLSAGVGKGFSMTLATKSDVELGYGASRRVVTSSITLQAATAPQVGFTLALNAVGVPGSGETADGLTPNTKLSSPTTATFLVPDLFGISGVNLWSLSGQIGWQGTSPSLALATTTYLNPAGGTTKNVMSCTDTCGPEDWMVGNLVLDLSLSNPCFAYSFDSGSGTSSLSIDGGVMKASKFQIGVAPLSCTVGVGDNAVTLPAGFAGFAFSATFGSATVKVATEVSTDGFSFDASLGDVTLAGVLYKNLALDISITPSSSTTSFDAVWTVGKVGDSNVHADMSVDSQGLEANISGSIPSFATRVVGTFELSNVTFSGSVELGGSCGSMSSSAAGTLKLKGGTYTLNSAVLNMDCNGLQTFSFSVTFTHKSSTKSFAFAYDKSTGLINGDLSVSWSASWDHKPVAIKYSGSISGTATLNLDIDTNSNSGSIYMTGKIDGSGTSVALKWSVYSSGWVSVTWADGSVDFSGSGTFRIKVGSYGPYTFGISA